jgi:hypothetical protein
MSQEFLQTPSTMLRMSQEFTQETSSGAYVSLQIKDCALGKGLFTTKRVGKDEVVFTLSGEIFDKPTRETIYIGGNKHIYDNYGMFINHSFAPTVRIEGVNVVAIRDIDADEELAFNYNDNEINMAAPFVVGGVLVCGSESCKN